MNPEELEELKQLIVFLEEHHIGEFDLERGDLKVRLKFAGAAPPLHGAQLDLAQLSHLIGAGQPHPAAPLPLPVGAVQPAPGSVPSTESEAAAASPGDDEEGLHVVKSPIVGTFYESSSPGAQAFVKAGDQIELGQVLCIVEAMKLMNEIESDVTGEIVKRFVANGQPIEYGQPLFAVRAS